jgi:hypothetical protein
MDIERHELLRIIQLAFRTGYVRGLMDATRNPNMTLKESSDFEDRALAKFLRDNHQDLGE